MKKERKEGRKTTKIKHSIIFCLCITIHIKYALIPSRAVTTIDLYITISASLHSFNFHENTI